MTMIWPDNFDPLTVGILWPGEWEFSSYRASPEVVRKVEQERRRHQERQASASRGTPPGFVHELPQPKRWSEPRPAPSKPPPAPPAARTLADRLSDAQTALYSSTDAEAARQQARALLPEMKASASAMGRRPPQDSESVQDRAERIKRELGL